MYNIGIILMAAGISLNVFAQICLKYASSNLSLYDLRSLIWLTASMLCYIGSFIFTAFVLRRLPLSSVGPIMAGMTFMFVAVAGWLIFKESMPISKIVGIILIFIGVLAVLQKNY